MNLAYSSTFTYLHMYIHRHTHIIKNKEIYLKKKRRKKKDLAINCDWEHILLSASVMLALTRCEASQHCRPHWKANPINLMSVYSETERGWGHKKKTGFPWEQPPRPTDQRLSVTDGRGTQPHAWDSHQKRTLSS